MGGTDNFWKSPIYMKNPLTLFRALPHLEKYALTFKFAVVNTDFVHSLHFRAISIDVFV